MQNPTPNLLIKLQLGLIGHPTSQRIEASQDSRSWSGDGRRFFSNVETPLPQGRNALIRRPECLLPTEEQMKELNWAYAMLNKAASDWQALLCIGSGDARFP